MTRTLTAIVRKEDNLYVAECSETGTASQGETIEKALANLKEATELYLDEFPLKSSFHPILTTFEVVSDAPESLNFTKPASALADKQPVPPDGAILLFILMSGLL